MSQREPSTGGKHEFQSTQWSVVLEAANGVSDAAKPALTSLCETYWYPLYAYVRRRGVRPEGAEDLIQGFFLHLLSSNAIAVANPGRGRFRSFLLTALRNYMAKEYRSGTAISRGGGALPISIDAELFEQRVQLVDADSLTPEQIFDRCWLRVLLDTVAEQLRADYLRAGRLALFEALQPNLTATRPESHAELAEQLGMTAGGVGMSLHRMRRRFGELIRNEIVRTLDDRSQLEDELKYLLSLAGSPS